MSNIEKRVCKVCKKEYDFVEEKTITFMEGNIGIGSGTEYVVCDKCFEKYFNIVKKGVKR
jgi:hypothetical protein